MRNALQLRNCFLLWLLVLWSVCVYGAEPNLATGMGSIPLAAVGWCVLLSLIGGAAFTTNKISRPNIVIKNVLIEVTKDILMSLVAGLITFFVSSQFGVAYWLQAALITISGYGGSKVLDKYLSKGLDLMDTASPRLGQVDKGEATNEHQ